MNVPKVSIFGIPVSKLDFQETVSVLTDAVGSGRPHHVVTANPIMVMAALNRPEHMALMKRAELVVPDGAGLVWAAGYAGEPVAGKVAGIELMHELIRIGEQRGWKVYLLGASPDVIQAAVDKLKQQYPRIILAGFRDGFFGSGEDEAVIARIRAASPDLLFVGRSADTQDIWIDKHKEQLGVPLMMGVGGSFDVLAGKVKRAPKLWINLRLEWLYRLIQEPYRYKRMLDLPKFVLKVVREKENVRKP